MSDEQPAGVREAMQLAEAAARGPFWGELCVARAERDAALADLDDANEEITHLIESRGYVEAKLERAEADLEAAHARLRDLEAAREADVNEDDPHTVENYRTAWLLTRESRDEARIDLEAAREALRDATYAAMYAWAGWCEERGGTGEWPPDDGTRSAEEYVVPRIARARAALGETPK